MKVIVLLTLCCTYLCYAFNPIPGDNTGYEEGVSRHIWMPDAEGTPHLVDLHETPTEDPTKNGANNQYWLFTRSNPSSSQVLVHNNEASVRNSNFDANRQTIVIVHGWTGNAAASYMVALRNELLYARNINVIAVDWRGVAGQNYVSAVLGVPGVGQFLGNFMTWLVGLTNGDWNRVHLVGISLGAHVIGNAGRNARSLPRRLTGVDPAGPLWERNSNALAPTDGVYVEAIHTDGGGLGILNPSADADFYPNGGTHPQPGCLTTMCSHGRGFDLFASSVHTNHFVGRRCLSLNQATSNSCFGISLNMGNDDMTKSGSGLYGLTTGRSWPY